MTDLRLDGPEPPAFIAIRQRTGLADEMWREIAPLLAEEGITEDTDPTDLPTLQTALERAVARYNAALFTPSGRTRSLAAELLRRIVAAVAAGETVRAAGLLDSVGAEATAEQPVTNAHTAGLAMLLLDSWSLGPAGVPAGLLTGTALPPGHWRGGRAAIDILALARKDRAHRSVQKLIVRHGGNHVTDGAALALAATVLTWAQRTRASAADVAETAIG